MKNEMERIWREHKLAFVGHKAGWKLEEDCYRQGVGFWRVPLIKLRRVRGARVLLIRKRPWYRLTALYSNEWFANYGHQHRLRYGNKI